MRKNGVISYLVLVASAFLPDLVNAQVGATANTVIIHADRGKNTISRHICGHFSEHLGRCIYGGLWVGENARIPNTRGIRSDVVQALKAIGIPSLRWPGGCFADEYHWMDGIGPRGQRPKMINTHWGGVTEDNSFGTHEFLDLCELLGCEPVICGNLGSGTVREMSQWVEYLNSDSLSPMTELRKTNGRDRPWKVKYWDLGNENWGCGGNMTPETYADLMRQYSTYCRSYEGATLFKIACGPSGTDYNWTEVLMREPKNRRMFQGLALHYYTSVRMNNQRISATEFGEEEWFAVLSATLNMETLISRHSEIMDQYDPEKRIALVVDEWGTWYAVEPGTNPRFLYQQNSLRDALVAAINLNIFNNHCERVRMANLAQTVNVLQSMVLTHEDQMVLTPSYYVFKMYKVHHDATLLPVESQCQDYVFGDKKVPALHISASKDAGGSVHVTIANLDPNQGIPLVAAFKGMEKPIFVRGEVITAPRVNAYNDFGKAEDVGPQEFPQVTVTDSQARLEVPSKSVLMLEFK